MTDFKNGDKVRIVRLVANNREGVHVGCNSYMSDMVNDGKIYTIKIPDGRRSEFDHCTEFEEDARWIWPFEALVFAEPGLFD